MTFSDIIGCFGEASSLPLSSASGTQKPWLFRVGHKKILKAGRALPKLEFCLSDEFGFGSVSAVGTCLPSQFDFSGTSVAVKNTKQNNSCQSLVQKQHLVFAPSRKLKTSV